MKCPHCHMPVAIAADRPFYKTAQAAAIAGVSAQTIINWLDAGRFPAERIGRGGRRIIKRPFLEYLVRYGSSVAQAHLDALNQEEA